MNRFVAINSSGTFPRIASAATGPKTITTICHSVASVSYISTVANLPDCIPGNSVSNRPLSSITDDQFFIFLVRKTFVHQLLRSPKNIDKGALFFFLGFLEKKKIKEREREKKEGLERKSHL